MCEYYSVQQAAEMTGLSAHTLRYYERVGLLSPVSRAANGHRQYSEDDLGAIEFLKLLRTTGMSIQQMQRFVALTRSSEDTTLERCELLDERRQELQQRIDELQSYLKVIEAKVAYYRSAAEANHHQFDLGH